MSGPPPVPVYIVEDHPLFREALAAAFRADPGFDVVGVAATTDEVGRASAPGGHQRTVVLLDYSLPGVSGADAVARLSRMAFRVLVVSASENVVDVRRALRAGAAGYVSKSAQAEQIVYAARAVARGAEYLAPSIASRLAETEPGEQARAESPAVGLTARETAVLRAVVGGETDRDIAARFQVSVRTVRSYLDAIAAKTGRRRRPDLIRLAMDLDLTAEGVH